MNCPCPACNGKDPVTRGQNAWSTDEETPQEKSLYDQLDEVYDKIANDYLMINEEKEEALKALDKVLELIDSIDNEVVQLQRDCIKRQIDFTQYKLGEISKKLY